MAVFLTSRDVGLLLSVRDYIEILEQAYDQLGKGESSMLPRIKLDASQRTGFLKILPAALSGAGVAGIHAYTGGGRGDFLKVIMIYDIASGNLEAIIEADRIGWLAPGAASAVATKYLAGKDARVMALIGSGRQAKAQLLAISCVRELSLVKVYSPLKEHRDAFCEEMGKLLDMPVVPAVSPEEAVAGAQVITTATNTRNPVFNGELINPGVHINAIGAHDPGRREVDETCIMRSKVVVDSRERALQEEGALLIPMGEGLIGPTHVYGELGEIVAGKKAGRINDEEITMFISGAVGIEYVAIGAEVYRRAREKGLGQELSLARDGDVPRSLYIKKR
jgi:alanine dehydrogenase